MTELYAKPAADSLSGGRSGKAVLLLGHGSKAHEANETLRRIAATVKERGGYGAVVPGFLQMERPDFQEAVDEMVSDGYLDITVMPYFLYMGLHVTKDLPEEMDKARARHEGLSLTLTGNLGYHSKLIDITIERIEGACEGAQDASTTDTSTLAPSSPAPSSIDPSVCAQHPIEAESFRIIEEELGEHGFTDTELPLVKRVIHSTADFGFKDILRMSPGAIDSGVRAITGGAAVITDVRMVESGITPARLAQFGARTVCFTGTDEAKRLAEEHGSTRTAAAMRLAKDVMEGAIVAVGNAPTALREVLAMVREGVARPALIVGVPVGFVGAVEAKEELMASGVEFISTTGRKGGSTVAVAIVNAIAIEALRRAREPLSA